MKLIRKYLYLACVMTACPLSALAGPVNVNTADAQTISDELLGIGLSKAAAIIEYREANGPFESIQDLQHVKGIGVRTIDMNRANILLQGQPPKTGK